MHVRTIFKTKARAGSIFGNMFSRVRFLINCHCLDWPVLCACLALQLGCIFSCDFLFLWSNRQVAQVEDGAGIWAGRSSLLDVSSQGFSMCHLTVFLSLALFCMDTIGIVLISCQMSEEDLNSAPSLYTRRREFKYLALDS